MSIDSKFIKEATSNIEKLVDTQESTLEINLNNDLFEKAQKLQQVLSLSKDVFFNVLANYGAYCCSKEEFNENQLPKDINGIIISFKISTDSETALNKHPKYDKSIITAFGLTNMCEALL